MERDVSVAFPEEPTLPNDNLLGEVRISLIAETVENPDGLTVRSHHREAVSVGEEEAEKGGVAVPAMRGWGCGPMLRNLL